MDLKPFFLVGCGRSGTSLLRSLLNAHSRIAIPTESLFMIDYLRVQDRYPVNELIDLILDEPEIVEWGLNLKRDDLSGCESIPQIFQLMHRLYAAEKDADVWGEKTPRFIRYMELLGTAFPEAQFVHLIRDPRAVVNSLMRSDVHRSNPYHGSVRWRMDVTAGLAYEEAYPERVLRVRYEELVSDPRKTLEDILGFLALSFEERMLTDLEGTEDYSLFYSNIHRNLDHAISTEHIRKWEHQLQSKDIEFIECMLADLMHRLGYSLRYQGSSIPTAYRMQMQIRRLKDLVLQSLKYYRQRRAYLYYLLKRKWKLGLLWEFLWTVNF